MLKKAIGAIWRKLSPSVRMTIVRGTQGKFTVSAAVIVENEAGEILLLDHVLRTASGWGVPGGFLAAGEQPSEAARRELREETGLELKNLELLRVRTIGQHIEIFFRAQANGNASVKSREINAVGWFEIDKMPEKMSRAQKTTIKDLLKNNL